MGRERITPYDYYVRDGGVRTHEGVEPRLQPRRREKATTKERTCAEFARVFLI